MPTQNASFDLLRKRLAKAATSLREKANHLNSRRIEAFGRVDARLLARMAAITENNCVARDIVRVGDQLLFGYNVYIGLKREIRVEDVFGLYQLQQQGEEYELKALSLDGSFLGETRFQQDFRELYTYYRATTLEQLRIAGEKLLLIFRTGSGATDRRVFRFAQGQDGKLHYQDNRGERDHVLPPTHDFEWVQITREQHVLGRHPHVNVLDTVFVETVGGDLTVKVENNTDTGLGVYAEPVEDMNQSLADGEIFYADLKHLILLKIRPYREQQWRYLVFNRRLRQVTRIDEIGAACLQLPEDHGIVFPGGYYLENGEHKRFSELGHDFGDFILKRQIRAPNGEDVLYVFYSEARGRYALLPYNLVERSLGQLLMADGYARMVDGRLLLFTPDGGEPTRIHTMQLWQTPFAEEEYERQQARVGGFFGRLGNAELVRGIGTLKQLSQLAEDARQQADYTLLLRVAGQCSDAYPWMAEDEVDGLQEDVSQLARSARAALEAYEQLERNREAARQAVTTRGAEVASLCSRIAGLLWRNPNDFTDAIRDLKRKRGELSALAGQPFVDGEAIAALDQRLSEQLDEVGERAMGFFAQDSAFQALQEGLAETSQGMEEATTTAALQPLSIQLDELAESLNGLSDLIAGFESSDATQRASLLQSTSALFADVNRLRAALRSKRDTLQEREQGMEFGAQLTVLDQSLNNALSRAEDVAAVDEALARIISQIEQMEARFGEQPSFAAELITRRETVMEAFAARRDQLHAQRERRAQGLIEALERILAGIPRRLAQLEAAEDIHAFFASDLLLERARSQIEELRRLDRAVDADEAAGKLASLRESGLRDARDRAELGTDGNSLRLGNQRFTIERRALDIAVLADERGLSLQLTGTDYRRRLDLPEAEAYRDVWTQMLISETAAVYRAEVLAWRLFLAWQKGEQALVEAARLGEEALLPLVVEAAQSRPQEDYQRGIHDTDAARLLHTLIRLHESAGLLAAPAAARVLAQAHVAELSEKAQRALRAQAAALGWFVSRGRSAPVPPSWTRDLQERAQALSLPADTTMLEQTVEHLVRCLGNGGSFPATPSALELADAVRAELPTPVLDGLRGSGMARGEALDIARGWCQLINADASESELMEAAAILLFDLPRERVNAELRLRISGLRGDHPRLKDGEMDLELPEFVARLGRHLHETEPAFQGFARLRHSLLVSERERLRLEQFQARPMAGFVRNQLIDQAYLPLIGNNLAKQIGSVDSQRSDRSGLLLLISPPGYGKTTLMEYLADRLGMIFVRINGPTLGHETRSLDPAEAPHRGAADELEKLNLGLAMGNNVMLYLDDIQHLDAEFLQKFISLSDGTRRIDAVVDGQARTLDLRGKRFAIVMAGNPYTEAGEVFRLPDMLANRADVYNLGDVLSGREGLFKASYIENSLTANPLTAPLAEQSREVILAALRAAEGAEVNLPAGLANASEIIETLKRLLVVRDVLARVNAAYVASAAQDDAFRTEPPFKLQGSYRNMIKLASQVSPLMTDQELDSLVRDHYRGEAQTLAARAEENLLKLWHLIGQPNEEERARWQAVCDNFQRLQKQGGKGADGAQMLANLLADISQQLGRQTSASSGVADMLSQALGENRDQVKEISQALHALGAAMAGASEQQLEQLRAHTKALLRPAAKTQLNAELSAPAELTDALSGVAKAYSDTLVPIVSAMHRKLTLDTSIWENVRFMRQKMEEMDVLLRRAEPPKK